ncbi:hypothetical protein Ahy_B08g093504 [Arachis hypogaea]|uniref:Transposase MuDR plant domain-containing protein n=1 Tax=Arachis hypogaea TaxID=3818 RepID=A0A444Y684_ARAHY|nr:hypothetical protein Ahy_B08g093504 [Arachis hypogaea]
MELLTEVGDVSDGGSGKLDFMQDDPPLAPPLLHVVSPVEDMDVDDDDVKFRVGHRFKSRDAVMQGVKNYSIRRSVEYRIVESDRLKYHVHCR